MSEGTHRQEFHCDTALFRAMENEEVSSTGIDVQLAVGRRGDIYTLAFHCSGVLTVPCDRCLDPVDITVDTDYTMTVKYGDEYSEDADDSVTIPETQSVFNVAEAIYSTLLLALPLQKVHQPGSCNPEMERMLLENTCDCGDDDFSGDYDAQENN